MFDPQLYRSRDEVEEWKKRDPIPRLTAWMRSANMLHAGELEAIEGEVTAEIDAAVAFSEADAWEKVEDLLRHVHAEPAP
jgi:TPP-dependent pyruvate/acetoin dehydrogenase alpha subunit